MKKFFAFLALTSLSLNCYAQFSPTVSLNESNCAAITKGNLTSCFFNKADNLADYKLRQTLIYDNGLTEESMLGLGATKSGLFAVISTSSADLKKKEIISAWYSVIRGDLNKYQVMPGCNIELTQNSISKSILSIHKTGNFIYCK